MTMTQALFLKNLPAPLQFLIRPMLIASVTLHSILLLLPTEAHKQPVTPTKKEPEKVKITQLPTTTPLPKVSPLAVAKPSPLMAQVKPTPVIQKPIVIQPKPNPIRQQSSFIPPIEQTKSIPRPLPQSAPSPQPTTTTQATPTTQPTPLAPPTAVAQATQATPTPQNPFADFPFPTTAQLGSVGLLSGDNDKSARNTAEALDAVVAFYSKELPAKKFASKPVTNEADLKVFQVSKEGGADQFLHLVSKDGKTVILLASQQVADLKSLKDAGTRSQEEIAFDDNVVKPLENDEKLVLNAVEPSDLAKIPDAAKFADVNKFQPRVKTGKLAPKSPQELAATYATQLGQAGFTTISQEAAYGGALVYKVTQGKFKTYMYFVVNSDNNTIVLLSKDSPY